MTSSLKSLKGKECLLFINDILSTIICKNLYLIWLHHALPTLTKWCLLLWCCLQYAQRRTPWSTRRANPSWECSGLCWWSWRPLLLPSPTARASLFKGVHTSASTTQNSFWYKAWYQTAFDKLSEQQKLRPLTKSWSQGLLQFLQRGYDTQMQNS